MTAAEEKTPKTKHFPACELEKHNFLYKDKHFKNYKIAKPFTTIQGF